MRSGGAAIADGVFDRPRLAAAIEQVARDDRAPFAGLWLMATREKMVARIVARRGDPSDATPAVLDMQMEKGEAPDGWTRLDAARERVEILADALKVATRT